MAINKNLPWKSITNELYRDYIYESGFVYRILRPVAVAMSASGGHRVFNMYGECYYVKAGWAIIKWEGKEKGVPQYAF